MTELAVGYVSVVAETRGMGATIDKAMRGIQSQGASYGRGLGVEVKKGFESAKPVDMKQVEQNFTDSEKRRAAVVKRTTDSVEDSRRKEQIATAKLAEVEKKYAADSSQVLSAKDRLVAASQKVQIQEAKQSVAVEKASRDVDDAKRSLDQLSAAKDATSGKAKSFGVKMGDTFRGVGRDAGTMGRDVGQSFAKIGQGDFKGAFSGLKSAFGITKREGKTAGVDTGQSFSKGLGKEVREGSKQMATWLKVGLVGVAAKIGIDFGAQFKSALTGASNLEQSVGGMKAIFKDDFAEMDKAAQGAAQTLGLSQNAYNELATTVGAGLNNKGIKDYAGSTQDLLGLGADLAAQFGGTTEEAVQAVSSLMRGESDPIERYGVAINETAISAELAARGQSKLTGAALETAKAQARMDILFRQTADAQGTFARESDTMAGKQQRATAAFDDFKTALGSRVLPVATLFFGFLNDKAIPGLDKGLGVVDKAIAGVKSLADMMVTGDFTGGIFGIQEDNPAVGILLGIRDAVGITMESVKLLFSGDFVGSSFGIQEDNPLVSVVLGIRNTVIDAFDAAKDAVSGFVEGFGGMDAIGSSIGPVLTLLTGPLGILKTVLFDLMKNVDFEDFGAAVGGVFGEVSESAGVLVGLLSGALATVFSELVPLVGDLAPVLGQVVVDLLPELLDLAETLVPLLGDFASIGVDAITGAVELLTPILTAVITELSTLVGWLADNEVAATTLATVIGTVLVAKYTLLGITAGVSAAKQAAAWVVASIGAVVSTTIQVASFALLAAAWLVAKIQAGVAAVGMAASWLLSTAQTIGALALQAAAFVAQRAVLIAQRVATVAATAAQWLFNAALAANPIGLVIAAVAALVAGLVWFFTQTEVGKAAWEKFTTWLVDTWSWVRDTGLEVWENLKTKTLETFEKLQSGVGAIWDGIKKVIGTPINAVIGFINKGIIGAYNWVADFLGLGTMDEIGTLDLGGGGKQSSYISARGWRDGGYTGDIDPSKIAGAVHGKEYVLTEQETRSMGGPKGVEMWKHNALGAGYKGGGYVWPTNSRRLSGNYKNHSGIDIPVPIGSPVYAVDSGKITYTGTGRGYGRAIMMQDSSGVPWVFGHNSSYLASPGQSVNKGQRIANSGNTGNSSGPHVHAEAARGGFARASNRAYTLGLLNGSTMPQGGGEAAEPVSIWATIGGKIAEGFKTITDWISGAMEKVTAPFKGLADNVGNSPFGKLVLGVGDKIKTDLSSWVKGKIGIGSSDSEADTDKPKRGYANGTRYAMPGLARVGEGRSEVVDFRGGERVYSGGESEALLNRGGIHIGQITLSGIKTLREVEAFLAELEDSRRVGHMMGA